MEENTVAVRARVGKDLGGMDLAVFVESPNQEIASLSRHILDVKKIALLFWW